MDEPVDYGRSQLQEVATAEGAFGLRADEEHAVVHIQVARCRLKQTIAQASSTNANHRAEP